MYNLCFIARRPFDDFCPAVYKKIVEKYDSDAKGIFITCDKRESKYIEDKFSGDAVEIIDLSTYMNTHWDEFTLDRLVEYEKKYDAAPIWKYIYTDRFLIYRDYDYCVHTACGLFAFWEYVFETYEVDYYYDEVIATLFTYVAYLVGKKTDTKYLTFLFMRSIGLDLSHHYVINDPFELCADFPEDYKTKEFTKEQRQIAEEFLSKFEEKHTKPAFMNMAAKKPKFKKDFLVLPFFYIRQRFFNPCAMDKGSYIYYRAYEHTMDSMKFYFRYKKCRKYYEKADLDKKFIYFPLHLQPEASTIVCARKYEKQLYFIDSIAKSIPADTVIYLKEHPSLLGSREESFYEALKEYPNVKCIEPWEDSLKLIDKAECVVTLTGSAGQEAMMLGKPVIIGGNVMYQNAPGVIKLEDVFDNYLDALASWQKPSREEILQWMTAYVSCAIPGNTYGLSADRLKDDNIEKIADSFMSYVARFEK